MIQSTQPITPPQIYAFVTLLAALSVASERLVEIVKGLVPWMNSTNSNAKQEGWRQAALHLLAAVCGVVTAWMASFSLPMNTVPDWLGKGWGICIFGLMVSGGSGFWNSILSYVKATKDIQQSQVPQTKPLAPASAV